MKPKTEFKAGVVQFDVVNGRVEENMATALSLLDRLADQGASLAVLPEFFSTGFDNEKIRGLAKETPRCIERLSRFALDRQVMVCGSFPVPDKGKVFNTLVVIGRDGRVKGDYRKLHLFRPTLEHVYYAPGDRMVKLDTDLGALGLMICYDLRFPELARTLALSGVTLFIVPAQWPSARASHWQTLIRARAIENQAFVIAANRTGQDQGLEFPGLSMIVDPAGRVLACGDEQPGAWAARIDPARIAETAKQIPVMSDRRKDVYE